MSPIRGVFTFLPDRACLEARCSSGIPICPYVHLTRPEQSHPRGVSPEKTYHVFPTWERNLVIVFLISVRWAFTFTVCMKVFNPVLSATGVADRKETVSLCVAAAAEAEQPANVVSRATVAMNFFI